MENRGYSLTIKSEPTKKLVMLEKTFTCLFITIINQAHVL